MVILGLNAWHADASAALLVDGELVAAVEEERLNRVKHCAGFPRLAARECLRMAGLDAGAIDHVAVSRDPSANLARKALSVLTGAAPASMLGARLANAGRVRSVADELRAALDGARLYARVHHVEHHRAHLASAFYPSGFDEAAVLSIDGFGDFSSTMMARGSGTSLEILGALGWPHSLGIFYTAVSQWLGFDRYGDEGKVMGLAPYGRPTRVGILREACFVTDEWFNLSPEWFNHSSEGVTMSWDEGAPSIGRLWSRRFVDALGPARPRDAALTQHHHDVAASLQAITEEVIMHLARRLQRRTGARRLCLAGGVALNSVANGKIRAQTPFTELYIQPAAGDGGTALGAALYVEHALHGRPRRFTMAHPYTGPAFDDAACESALASLDNVQIDRLDEATLVDRVAAALADGAIAGWFQGRMELGPRALGNRSLLADPRRAEMKDVLNARVKHREPFRPFAPSVLAERASEWFVDAQPSPAMLLVLPVMPELRARVPAIVHVDGSGRLQTVERATNPRFYRLIEAFARLTGVPMLLNTSFNENEPIVCTPAEAIACFQRTKIDLLALGNFLVRRR
jgi:carbamoyltransferase